MGISKHSGKPCLAKGYPTGKFNSNGNNVYKCRFHGGGNTDYFGFKDRAGKGGFKKSGYDDTPPSWSISKNMLCIPESKVFM